VSEKKQAIVRSIYDEIWNSGDLKLVNGIFEPGSRLAGLGTSVPDNPEGLKRLVVMCREAFPDLVFSVTHQIAEGNTVATRWTATGTHRGEFLDVPPTGERFELSGVCYFRFKGNRIKEGEFGWNWTDLVEQLSVETVDGV